MLRVNANVSAINVFVNSTETNFGKPTEMKSILLFIEKKFNGQEVRIVDKLEDSDFIIDASSDTKEDISSDVLEKNYTIKLATLIINLQLKNKLSGEVLFFNK